MSAVRRKSNRTNRAALSSPYTRPAKKSSWSLSGILSYLNPLRLRDSTHEQSTLLDEDPLEEGEGRNETTTSTPAQALSKRGRQLESNGRAPADLLPSSSDFSTVKPLEGRDNPATTPTPGPRLPTARFTFTVSSSPARNLDAVSDYLTQHVNKPITEGEVKNLVSLLQQSKPAQAPEPFRFESRSPTTPPRSKSPSVPPGSTTHTPRTLTRNPNGTYTWKGAGSARTPRSRNNFASPAFRTSRSTPARMAPNAAASTNEIAGGDAKRRRLEDSLSTSDQPQTTVNHPTQNQIPFPITTSPTTSRTVTTGQSSKPPAATTPSRLRTPGLPKPTVPTNPSPLRQAWSDGLNEPGLFQGPVKQTETAKHVTELVNSLKSRDKVLDVRNPYETASPVKPRPTVSKRKRTAGTTKKPPVAATTPKDNENELSKDKLKEMSAHAIIEATLPEGSKRSRPPPNFEKPIFKDQTPPEEEKQYMATDGDDDEIRVVKRLKPPVNGHSASHAGAQKKSSPDADAQAPRSTVKETKEKLAPIKVPVAPVPSSQTTKAHFGPKSSVPKEPSKLRFSMQAESASAPSSPGSAREPGVDSAPKSAPPLVFSVDTPTTAEKVAPAATLFTGCVTLAPVSTTKSAKDTAKALSIPSLPVFTFTAPSTLSWVSAHTQARDEAKTMPKTLLPTFDFTNPVSTFAPAPAPAPVQPPAKGFDWTAAGMKPASSAGGEWTCDSCMLKNPSNATEKCTICDAPKPDVAPTPKATFDWGAAGLKPVTSSTGNEWTCNQCMLKNPASATEKCTICEASKPGAAPSAPKAGFDWSAAGLKPPAPVKAGEWTCETCMCKNSADAKEKCTVCGTLRS